MFKFLGKGFSALILSFLLAVPAGAAAPYYEGKAIRLIVGFSPAVVSTPTPV